LASYGTSRLLPPCDCEGSRVLGRNAAAGFIPRIRRARRSGTRPMDRTTTRRAPDARRLRGRCRGRRDRVVASDQQLVIQDHLPISRLPMPAGHRTRRYEIRTPREIVRRGGLDLHWRWVRRAPGDEKFLPGREVGRRTIRPRRWRKRPQESRTTHGNGGHGRASWGTGLKGADSAVKNTKMLNPAAIPRLSRSTRAAVAPAGGELRRGGGVRGLPGFRYGVLRRPPGRRNPVVFAVSGSVGRGEGARPALRRADGTHEHADRCSRDPVTCGATRPSGTRRVSASPSAGTGGRTPVVPPRTARAPRTGRSGRRGPVR
jgi:hypothetical protein